MKKIINKILGKDIQIHTEDNHIALDLLSVFVQTEKSLSELPELLPVEKVQFEQGIAIGHLYNSSKIEGTSLNEKRLQKAINAQGV